MPRKTEDQYIKLKIDIDRQFGQSELDRKSMKDMAFYCRSKMTNHRALEQCSDFKDLCDLLEQNLVIDKNNVDFIRSMLEHCCSDRKDVLEILDKYEGIYSRINTGYNHHQSSRHGHNLDREIEVISSEIGRDWRPLARALGLNEADIDQVTERHQNNLREQVIEALQLWIKKPGGSASKIELEDALKRSQKRLLAEKVRDCRA